MSAQSVSFSRVQRQICSQFVDARDFFCGTERLTKSAFQCERFNANAYVLVTKATQDKTTIKLKFHTKK